MEIGENTKTNTNKTKKNIIWYKLDLIKQNNKPHILHVRFKKKSQILRADMFDYKTIFC